MQDWRGLARLGGRQHQVVALSQVPAFGIGVRTFQRHAARYSWERLHLGIYALPGADRTYQRDAMAALLAGGERSVLSHRSAVALHGLARRGPRPLQLLVPTDRAVPRRRGIAASRSQTLVSSDVVMLGPLRVTCIPRTLCDLEATTTESQLRELTAVALQSRRTTLERVEACAVRLDTRVLQRVVCQLRGTRSDSGFERRVRGWLVEQGLPPHPGVYPVIAEDGVTVRLDVAYPQEMVYVDCLGFVWHSLPSALTTDAVRINGVVAAGWVGLGLDEAQFEQRRDVFLRQLRALLAERRGFADRWTGPVVAAPSVAPAW